MTIIGNTIINIEAGQPIGVNGSGIIIANNPNCTIVCNALQNIGGTGIKIYGGASGGQNSNNTTIVGNVIKKAGQGSTSAAATIAGISLEPGSGTVTNCTVVGNTIDTVGTPVGASGPAGITWSTSGNHIGANNITGVSPLYSRGGSPVDAGGAMFGTGYSIDATGLAVFLAGMKLSGSTSGYTDELAFQSTTSSVDSAISDLLTGTASMNFDHRGTSNTGQFRWRNGTGAGTLLALLSNNGLFTTYGKTATQGQGVPAIYQAPAPSLAQTAAVTSIATITSPNDGAKHVYRISGTVTITTLGSGNIQLQVTYTDSNGTARTCQIPLCAQVGAFVASATTADDYKGVVEITVNPNTAVTVKTAGTFTGCTYNTSGQIEQIL